MCWRRPHRREARDFVELQRRAVDRERCLRDRVHRRLDGAHHIRTPGAADDRVEPCDARGERRVHSSGLMGRGFGGFDFGWYEGFGSCGGAGGDFGGFGRGGRAGEGSGGDGSGLRLRLGNDVLHIADLEALASGEAAAALEQLEGARRSDKSYESSDAAPTRNDAQSCLDVLGYRVLREHAKVGGASEFSSAADRGFLHEGHTGERESAQSRQRGRHEEGHATSAFVREHCSMPHKIHIRPTTEDAICSA